MNKKFLVLVLLLIANTLVAQYILKGSIEGTKGEKISKAVIILTGTSFTTTSKEDGSFSFPSIKEGRYTLMISANNYDVLSKSIRISGDTDLGSLKLQESSSTAMIDALNLDFGDDDAATSSSFLSASRDLFQQTSAFQWGGFFFRPRGYDNNKSLVLFNGVIMNKAQNGRPLWRDWGGLNDITRYPKELTYGLGSSENTFGSLMGTTAFSTRASDFSKGGRISLSLTNYSYTQRAMATYATGMQPGGWAWVASASRRWGDEGVIDGTLYDAYAYFLSVEKKLTPKQSLNFTTFGVPYRKAGNSPNTQEVYNLAGKHYNAYWGWQDGKRRNERTKKTFEPIFMLSHYWDVSENTNITSTLSYQFGRNSYSRLERGDIALTRAGLDAYLADPRDFDPKKDYDFIDSPSPIYYRYLPSYAPLRASYDITSWDNSDPFAAVVLNRQINWNYLYRINRYNARAGLGAAYFLVDDVNEDKIFNAVSRIKSRLGNHLTFNGTLSYQYTHSNNFRVLKDLLGGLPIKNINFFQNFRYDVLGNNQRVSQGEKYGYDYDLNQHKSNAYGLFRLSRNLFDYELATDISYTQFWRHGHYKNDFDNGKLYTSLGVSKKEEFVNYGVKGALTFKPNGKNFIRLNGLYQTAAPRLNNAFPDQRHLNVTAYYGKSMKSSKNLSGELSYIHRDKKLKTKITGYFTQIKDDIETTPYYDVNTKNFVYVSAEDVNKQRMGMEASAEYAITSSLKAMAVASVGQYVYTNNPVAKYIGNGNLFSLGEGAFKNYKLSGSPQQAYSLGLEYRSPCYWWVSANYNLLSHNYAGLSPLKHTKGFVRWFYPYQQEKIQEEVKTLLKQEKFSAGSFVNVSVGKSWKINRQRLSASLNINNLLNNKNIKTGGFEQGYGNEYYSAKRYAENQVNQNRYWFQQGISFFANIAYRF